MNVATMISKYGKTVTLSRESTEATTDAEGIVTRGSASTSSIVMVIQPLSGDEVLRLPDGLRNKKVVKGYTVSEIICGDEQNKVLPDQIIDGDQTYEVGDVQYYEATSMNLSPYYRATLVRVNPV